MSYYHKINDPTQLRVAILQSAKEPVVILSEMKLIEELRQEKRNVLKDLSTKLGELRKLTEEFDNMLPERNLLAEEKRLAEKKAQAKKTEKISQPEKIISPATDVDRLEYTLDRIEQKLTQLSKT